MAPPNNPHVAKVALVGNRDTREWVNTFHVSKAGDPLDALDLLAIANTFYNWWHSYYRNAFSTSITLDQIQVRKLDPTDPLAVDWTTGLPENGTRTGGEVAQAPANATLALSLRTPYAGRKYRGRFYVPGLVEATTNQDDRVGSTQVSLFVNLLQQLFNVTVGGTFPLAIFHKGDNTFTNITSYVVDAIIDSQRRRLPGRGR